MPLRAHLGLYEDETAALCQWHIPEAHFLEMWSDVRADDGTVTIVQPLIAPLYDGKSAHEVLSAFTDGGERSGYDIVREFWSGQSGLSTQAPPAPAAGAGPASQAPAAPAASAPPAAGGGGRCACRPARRHRCRLRRCRRSRLSIARGAGGCTTA